MDIKNHGLNHNNKYVINSILQFSLFNIHYLFIHLFILIRKNLFCYIYLIYMLYINNIKKLCT